MRYLRVFISSLAAGAFIGFGCLFSNMAKALPFGADWNSVLAAVAFSVGMASVCFCGASLYTGKIGFAFRGDKKANAKALPIMLLGNILGIALFGFASYIVCLAASPELLAVIASVSTTRFVVCFSDLPFLLIQAVLCGVFVYLAVLSYKKAPTGLKAVCIALFIGAFVYMGLQHSIANCFYAVYYLAFSPVDFGWVALSVLTAIVGNSIGALSSDGVSRLFEIKPKAKPVGIA